MSSIKKYNLIRQIGEGGFGTVSIGQEIGRYKKFFAIKVQKIERIMRNRGADDRAAAEVKVRFYNTYFLNLKFNYPIITEFCLDF